MQRETIAILGLGETGFSVLKHLYPFGHKICIFDQSDNPPYLKQVIQFFSRDVIFRQTDFLQKTLLCGFQRIIISPGISDKLPAIANASRRGIPIESEIECFAKFAKAPVIAITGSNGKSTVTKMVGAIAQAAGLQVAIGGNLGPNALGLINSNIELYVLELSSFQLEHTYSLAPFVATVLNISPDHLDRYDTFEDYQKAKLRIFKGAQKAVVNRQFPALLPEKFLHLPIISFGAELPSESGYGLISESLKTYLVFREKNGKLRKILAVSELKLLGRQNYENALSALAIANAAGIQEHFAIQALKNFQGLAHRCEWVADNNHIIWVNDSKGTNVGASIAALEGLAEHISGKWILILGGRSKGADFSPLKSTILKYAKCVLLIGESQKTLQALLSCCIETQCCQSLKDAVILAHQYAEPGDGVLFSPACASFDMFDNFAHRGDLFKKWVKELII